MTLAALVILAIGIILVLSIAVRAINTKVGEVGAKPAPSRIHYAWV